MMEAIDKTVEYELKFFIRQFKTKGMPYILGLALRLFDKDYLGIINDNMAEPLFVGMSISFTLLFLVYLQRYIDWRKNKQTSILVNSFYILLAFLFLSGILVALFATDGEERDSKEDFFYMHLIISAITLAFYFLYRLFVKYKNKSRQSKD